MSSEGKMTNRNHFAALASAICFLTLVIASAAASAATITATLTTSSGPVAGDVESLDFTGSSLASFITPISELSTAISTSFGSGTTFSELDFTVVSPPTIETLAFQNVMFTNLVTNTNVTGITTDTVTFSFLKETTTVTPLPV